MNSSKTSQLITKLIRLTNEDSIHWEISEPPDVIVRGTDDIVPIFFRVRLRDKFMAIYKRRYQEYFDESGSFFWHEQIVLAILDEHDHVLWETSERSPALRDLLDTVREKTAGIDELISEFLDEPEKH